MIDNLKTAILEILAAMNPHQRKDAFEAIQALYCIHCGGEHPSESYKCQCWNDE
jgi:hypothetical protein